LPLGNSDFVAIIVSPDENLITSKNNIFIVNYLQRLRVLFDFLTINDDNDRNSNIKEARMALPQTKNTTNQFPRKAVEQCLGSWWDKKLSSPLIQRRSAEECRASGGTVFDIQPELSSNQAVTVLLDLEDIVGFEPTKGVIRRGGYKNRQEFVQDMCSRVEAEHRVRTSRPPLTVPAKEVTAHARL
jgi:hypothetical protein